MSDHLGGFRAQKDKDGNVVRTSEGRIISAAPRSDLEAWQLALEHRKLAPYFVNLWLGPGIETNHKGKRTLHKGPKFLGLREFRDDLKQIAFMGLFKGWKTVDHTKGEPSTLLAYPVAQALDAAVDKLKPRQEKSKGKAIEYLPKGEAPDIAEDVADRIDLEKDTPLVPLHTRGLAEPATEPALKTDEAKLLYQLLEKPARRAPHRRADVLGRLRKTDPEAAEYLEWLERKGEDVATLGMFTRLARMRLNEPGLSKAVRHELETARRQADRKIKRLRQQG
jgi:hypothetical protein